MMVIIDHTPTILLYVLTFSFVFFTFTHTNYIATLSVTNKQLPKRMLYSNKIEYFEWSNIQLESDDYLGAKLLLTSRELS